MKKEKQGQMKTLKLSRETLRVLGSESLDQVNGGQTLKPRPSMECPSYFGPCGNTTVPIKRY